jgi:DNA-directed RNA polymerase specialized sigma24 family protein
VENSLEVEKRLLLLARAQDSEALETLATIVYSNVPPWLKSRFKEISYQEIEDAINDALTKFLEHPYGVRADSVVSFMAWIKKVAASRILDNLRLRRSG